MVGNVERFELHAVQSQVYPGATHVTVIPSALTQALKFLFAKQKVRTVGSIEKLILWGTLPPPSMKCANIGAITSFWLKISN